MEDLDEKKKSQLYVAAQTCDIETIDNYLHKGFNINFQDAKGDTLLHYAVRYGHTKLVSYLLRKKANILLKNKNGFTAFREDYGTIKINREGNAKLNQDKEKLDNYINECKAYILKHYINRNIFSRLMARHNGRARALAKSFGYCASIKEVDNLIKNQLDLFRSNRFTAQGVRPTRVPLDLLDARWSRTLKNKPAPHQLEKSQLYKVLRTLEKINLKASSISSNKISKDRLKNNGYARLVRLRA